MSLIDLLCLWLFFYHYNLYHELKTPEMLFRALKYYLKPYSLMQLISGKEHKQDLQMSEEKNISIGTDSCV